MRGRDGPRDCPAFAYDSRFCPRLYLGKAGSDNRLPAALFDDATHIPSELDDEPACLEEGRLIEVACVAEKGRSSAMTWELDNFVLTSPRQLLAASIFSILYFRIWYTVEASCPQIPCPAL